MTHDEQAWPNTEVTLILQFLTYICDYKKQMERQSKRRKQVFKFVSFQKTKTSANKIDTETQCIKQIKTIL